jgi:phosphate:Na+ symporter
MLSSILLIFAGFGVFLFGIQTFSSNIEKLSGNKMRKRINTFSRNRFAAIGSGFVFTTILQSSTAGIAMIAGFTSAGIISLFQAFGLTLGSSMASAIPNFLISVTSFNIKEFFYALAGVGILILLISKKNTLKNIGTAILGFSLIFIGMGLMSNGTSLFSSNPSFITFFQILTNPILLILLGTAFTIITQSSLATVAILMTLVGTSSIAGAIPISSALFIILGANLGTAISTLVLISLSSNIDGKRIGVFHLIYLTLGVIIFTLLSVFVPWVETLFSWVAEPAIKLAFINLTFNLVTGLIIVPLINPFVHLMRKIMPERAKKKNVLDIVETYSESSSISLAKANEKIILFYNSIFDLYKNMIDYIKNSDNSNYKKIIKDLSEYNFYINKLNMYVVRISNNESSGTENKEIEFLLNSIKQMERISRTCIKIVDVLNDEDKKITFSQKLQKYVDLISQNTNEMFEITKYFVLNPNCKFLEDDKVLPYYTNVLSLSKKNSEAKLLAKTFVIEVGFIRKSSMKKSTSYMELVSYLGLISNNLLDIVFGIVGQSNESFNSKYEQLILEEFDSEDKE